jgi:uncharacterized protein YbcV (DUF1398 family)
MTVFIADNFLNNNIFQTLRSSIESSVDYSIFKRHNIWYNSFYSDNGNLDDIKQQYGVIWFFIIKQIQEYALTVTNKKLIPYGLRYQATYADPATYQTTGWHFDGTVRGQDLKDCYTSIIYCSLNNTENYGGYWATRDKEYAPLSNRLILYRRDIEHAMTPPTVKWNESRKICLISWST